MTGWEDFEDWVVVNRDLGAVAVETTDNAYGTLHGWTVNVKERSEPGGFGGPNEHRIVEVRERCAVSASPYVVGLFPLRANAPGYIPIRGLVAHDDVLDETDVFGALAESSDVTVQAPQEDR